MASRRKSTLTPMMIVFVILATELIASLRWNGKNTPIKRNTAFPISIPAVIRRARFPPANDQTPNANAVKKISAMRSSGTTSGLVGAPIALRSLMDREVKL